MGDIPQVLLDPVFQYCSASQLAAIEDETRCAFECWLMEWCSQAAGLHAESRAGAEMGAEMRTHWTCHCSGSDATRRTLDTCLMPCRCAALV